MNDNNPVTGYDVMPDIVERLRQVHGDNDDAREAEAEIKRLEADIDKLLAECQGWRDEIERLREEVRQTRMRIADLEKQLFRATGRTP